MYWVFIFRIDSWSILIWMLILFMITKILVSLFPDLLYWSHYFSLRITVKHSYMLLIIGCTLLLICDSLFSVFPILLALAWKKDLCSPWNENTIKAESSVWGLICLNVNCQIQVFLFVSMHLSVCSLFPRPFSRNCADRIWICWLPLRPNLCVGWGHYWYQPFSWVPPINQ